VPDFQRGIQVLDGVLKHGAAHRAGDGDGIGTWGYPSPDTYDFIMEKIMIVLKLHHFETVEAVSACGFEGMLHGFDEQGKAFVRRFPEEMRHAYEAGQGLVRGS
jgi:hypothetical protein